MATKNKEQLKTRCPVWNSVNAAAQDKQTQNKTNKNKSFWVKG